MSRRARCPCCQELFNPDDDPSPVPDWCWKCYDQFRAIQHKLRERDPSQGELFEPQK